MHSTLCTVVCKNWSSSLIKRKFWLAYYRGGIKRTVNIEYPCEKVRFCGKIIQKGFGNKCTIVQNLLTF